MHKPNKQVTAHIKCGLPHIKCQSIFTFLYNYINRDLQNYLDNLGNKDVISWMADFMSRCYAVYNGYEALVRPAQLSC